MSEQNKQVVLRTVARQSAQTGGPTPNRQQKWASPKDWNDRIQDAVTELYINQDKSLKDVMAIMAKEYGHYGTKRMYISRLEAWGLVKNKKVGDMVFLMHKYQQRQALGKNTAFTVRGKEISYEKVKYYFEKRKKSLDMTESQPSTPPHILYRTPSPPPTFLVSENLFMSIKEFYEMSYASGLWRIDGAICINNNTGETEVGHLDGFLSSCQSATNLIEKKSYVEARRILSTGFGFIRSILEYEHPSALFYVLEALCRLRSHGMHEIDVLVRKYISSMSNIVFLHETPWAGIWRKLGTIDSNDIRDVLLQCWQCANDTAEKEFGRFHPWTISNFINRTHMRLLDDQEEELVLSKFLLEIDRLPAGKEKAAARAKILFNLGNCLEYLHRYDEEEIVALELAAYGRSTGSLIEELKGVVLLGPAQAKLGKNELAEANFRRSITIVETEKTLGPRSPWVIQQMGRLEEFLRNIGREQDADIVRAEINTCLNDHDVDAELEEITE